MSDKKILDTAKDALNTAIGDMKTSKKNRLDEEALKKKMAEVDAKQQKEEKQIREEYAHQRKNPKNDYHARVRLMLVSGDRREEIGNLGAYIGHKEGKQTLKVINKDKEVIFEEQKPDWQSSYNFTDKDVLEKRIKELKDTLRQFQNGEIVEKKDEKKNVTYYEIDYRCMLRQAEQDLAIKVLGGKGTYSEVVDGLDVYTFDIIGFFKIPMFYYSDKSLLGLPPAPKIIIGQYLNEVLYKDYKSKEAKAERVIMTIFAAILAIGIIAVAVTLYKLGIANTEQAVTNMETAKHIVSMANFSDIMSLVGDKIDTTNTLLQAQSSIPTQNMTQVVR